MESFKPQGIGKGIAINGIARIVQSAFGFFLLVFIAKRFGADFSTDGFLVTNALLGLFLLAGEGIVGVTFLPVYIEYRDKRSPEAGQEFFNCLFTLLFVCLAVISVMILIFASWIAFALAPGFAGEGHVITTNLMRISSPLVLLVGVTGMSATLFYAGRSFTVPALTSSFLVLGQILFLFLFGRSVGIYSVKIGAVFGVVCQAVVLIYFLEKRGMGPRFSWNPKHPGMRQVVGLLMPRLVGMATSRINVIVDRFFASTLEMGFVSALGYAERVIEIPCILVMEAVVKTLVPVLSEHDSAGEVEKIREKLFRILKGLNFFVIPTMVIFIVLREPLVRLLFERGAFGPMETLLSARALLFYSIGLLAYSYTIVLSAVFFSIQDTATPMKIGIVALVLNFFLDLILVGIMGMEGIALSTSIVALMRMGALLVLLQVRIGSLSYLAILKSALRFASASIPMVVAMWFIIENMGNFLDMPSSLISSILQTGTAFIVGGFVYLGICFIWKSRESQSLMQLLGRMLSV